MWFCWMQTSHSPPSVCLTRSPDFASTMSPLERGGSPSCCSCTASRSSGRSQSRRSSILWIYLTSPQPDWILKNKNKKKKNQVAATQLRRCMSHVPNKTRIVQSLDTTLFSSFSKPLKVPTKHHFQQEAVKGGLEKWSFRERRGGYVKLPHWSCGWKINEHNLGSIQACGGFMYCLLFLNGSIAFWFHRNLKQTQSCKFPEWKFPLALPLPCWVAKDSLRTTAILKREKGITGVAVAVCCPWPAELSRKKEQPRSLNSLSSQPIAIRGVRQAPVSAPDLVLLMWTEKWCWARLLDWGQSGCQEL